MYSTNDISRKVDILFLKKLSNGKYRYYEKFYDESEGKWKQASVTLTSKTRQAQGQAKRLLEKKIENRLLKYDDIDLNQARIENITIREVYEEYRELRKLELKDSTYATQTFLLDKVFENIFDKKLNEISGLYFQRYFMKSSNSLSYKKLQKTLINLFFKHAVKVGYLENNPIDSVELPKQRKTLEDVEKRRAKFLSKEEMKVFKQLFGTSPSEVRMNYLIEFMYLTGLRIGEALALMWENVNLVSKTINIKYTIDNHSVSIQKSKLSTPKTIDSFRVISVNDRCIIILSELRKLNDYLKTKKSSFIFLSTTGNLITPSVLNLYLKKVAKKANFDNKKPEIFSSHMLRHSHVSLLTELGIPIKVIMQRVGHRDEKTTLQIYTHVTEKMESDVDDKMNSFEI